MTATTKTHFREELVDQIELSLTTSLSSVEPDPRFVGHLHNRLVKKPEVEIENMNFGVAYLVVGIGLFFGVLMFWILSQVFKGMRGILLRG